MLHECDILMILSMKGLIWKVYLIKYYKGQYYSLEVEKQCKPQF